MVSLFLILAFEIIRETFELKIDDKSRSASTWNRKGCSVRGFPISEHEL